MHTFINQVMYNFMVEALKMKSNNLLIYLKRSFIFFILILSTACQNVATGSRNESNIVPTQKPTLLSTATPIIIPDKKPTEPGEPVIQDETWWFSESIPESIKAELKKNYPMMTERDKNLAAYWVTQDKENKNLPIIYEELYILTVPLISLKSGVEWEVLNDCWESGCSKANQILWVSDPDLPLLKIIFGSSNQSNLTISTELPDGCNDDNCMRIQNFNNIEPGWRVLPIDGNSPFENTFNKYTYPLFYRLYLDKNPDFPGDIEDTQNWMEPLSNFSPEKLTSVLMTGTTAMVRNFALNIENEGLTYPGKNISKILAAADFTHVSNEVSFYEECPPAKPLRVEMRFCSDPKYIDVLKESGVDIVELTGNHLLDWGPEAFKYTLNLYQKNGFLTFGGGINQQKASEPLIIEHHGNKIAFLGCNVPGPENDWATESRPGAAKCDLQLMSEQIHNLRNQGILPIVTFQDYEFEDFDPVKLIRDDFWTAAKAGAVIVSGSQAHFPQGIDNVDGTFVHYGLGNLYFDQMANWLRKATIDFHYFYDGRYVNSTIIPIINENFGQPRLMNQEEASKFLEIIYQHSFYYSKGQ